MSLVMQIPQGLERKLEAICLGLVDAGHARGIDFSKPLGEEALIAPRSVSWRVFKNPVSVFIGGIAAVILELAEPSVRTGVWEHSRFREDPVGRLRRTGSAAMVTVYGAKSVAKPMIARVSRMHSRVRGTTPGGVEFDAMDPRLLTWVHATAGYGFLTAYRRYTRPLEARQADEFYREGLATARLYGADGAPCRSAEAERLFDSMRGRLERSEIVFEFLDIVSRAPLLPRPLLWMQRMLVRAAVEVVPAWVRAELGLDERHGLRTFEAPAVRMIAALADRLLLPGSAPAQSCVRLGLPATYLYR
jgi:uncharacterized protein (DUF2236 family)